MTSTDSSDHLTRKFKLQKEAFESFNIKEKIKDEENIMFMITLFHFTMLKLCKGYQIKPGITILFGGKF